MALTIGDNFKYQANKPNFERDSFATLEAMKAYPETSIDDGHLSYCAETNKHYKFLSSNTVDETTGKWREFKTGASISEDGVTGQVLTKTDNGYEWQDPQGSQESQETRIVLDEFSERKFFGEFSKVTGAPAIGWAGALFIDDFSSSEHRDFYCCMTYGQGIVIRHTYATDTYEYLNSFIADSSTTSSSYNLTNKMNSGGWGNYYNGSELPLVYISRCSPDSSYIHTYYAYKINRSVTPFKFEKVLTIKYTGSKLAAITSDITIDAEKKHLYVHGYKAGSANAITGTSIVMVFNLPEPGSSDTITLTDSDILWEFEFFVNEAAQDLCVSGGRLYYPYGSKSVQGIAVIDTKTGEILQNLDLANISTNFISNPEPEGVALSNGNLYLNYHHADTNSNEVCLVEFALQGVKESLKVPTSQSEDSVDIPNATQSTAGLMSAEDKVKLDGVSNNANNYTHPAGSAASKSLGLYKISTDSTSHVKSVSPVTKSDITGLGIPEKDTTYNNATQSTAGLMSAEDKTKLDNLDTSGGVSDPRALNGATMRFDGFVSGVTTAQVGASEWDSIVYDTSINKFLAKKGTLSPTYYNIWSGMDAYMTDSVGTDILKDRLYLYGEDIYAWSDSEGTLIKVTPDIPNASQSEAGLMSAEDKAKLDNVVNRVILSEFSAKKFFGEYSIVVGADSIGWAGALLIDDFSSDKYRDFYCCMTYGQGIIIRHTYATDTYEYLNSFLADSSTTSSSYNQTNKMNSGGWGKVYNGSALPLAYISRCSPDTNYIHTYYAYQIDTSSTPYNFVRKLTIKYGGSKLANITSDITVDAEKKYLYIHGYKTGSANAITGRSIVMVFNLPIPDGSTDTVVLTDDDIVWEFEFFVNEAAQDLHVSGGKLYYPYGSDSVHGVAVIDTKNGEIIQNLDLAAISPNFINNPEPEGVAISNGNLYINYHHTGANNNEVCLVEFPLQEVKESIPIATAKSNGLLSSVDKEKLDNLVVLTQGEYDALEVKAENTIYFIKG